MVRFLMALVLASMVGGIAFKDTNAYAQDKKEPEKKVVEDKGTKLPITTNVGSVTVGNSYAFLRGQKTTFEKATLYKDKSVVVEIKDVNTGWTIVGVAKERLKMEFKTQGGEDFEDVTADVGTAVGKNTEVFPPEGNPLGGTWKVTISPPAAKKVEPKEKDKK